MPAGRRGAWRVAATPAIGFCDPRTSRPSPSPSPYLSPQAGRGVVRVGALTPEMTPSLALRREIFIDQLPIPRGPKAREMPAMNDRHGQPAHALQRDEIILDHAVIRIIDQ